MKHILFILDYFVPHVAPTGQLIHELCVEMKKKYSVEVIAMNSDSESIFTKLYDTENLDGITVYRIRTKKFDKTKKISRIRHEIEFFIKAVLVIMKIKRCGYAFVTSQPPILGGVLGVIFKLLKRGKFIYNTQDFNPEQTEAVGYIKSKGILNLVRKIDSFSCKVADKIVLVGRDMFETLERRGLSVKDKCVLINNWADDKKIAPLDDDRVKSFRREIAGDAKKVIMYSGNVGLYYDLENLIKVIGKFRDRKDLMFVFLGGGAKKRELEDYVEKEGIENIRFLPHQPKDKLAVTLNAADIHLVSSQKGIKGVSVPSKLYGIMAAGKAVLGVVEKYSEPWYIITESGCGRTVEPKDYEGFEKELLRYADMPDDTVKVKGLAGRSYLDENLGKNKAMEKYYDLFDAV